MWAPAIPSQTMANIHAMSDNGTVAAIIALAVLSIVLIYISWIIWADR